MVTTDDRGATALAERLRIVDFMNWPAVEVARLVLGEGGRFLSDGNCEQVWSAWVGELAHLRRVKAAAREHIRAVDAFMDEADPEDPDSVTRSEAALRAALESEIP